MIAGGGPFGRMLAHVEIVDVPSADARELYEAPPALVRPDQVVAWRGAGGDDAEAVLARAVGHR